MSSYNDQIGTMHIRHAKRVHMIHCLSVLGGHHRPCIQALVYVQQLGSRPDLYMSLAYVHACCLLPSSRTPAGRICLSCAAVGLAVASLITTHECALRKGIIRS